MCMTWSHSNRGQSPFLGGARLIFEVWKRTATKLFLKKLIKMFIILKQSFFLTVNCTHFTPANRGFNSQSQQHPSYQVFCWILGSASCHHLIDSQHKHQSQQFCLCRRSEVWETKAEATFLCSLTWSRLRVFVVTLICSQASSHIRSQLFWKGRQAPFYLHLHGVSLQKCILSWTNK